MATTQATADRLDDNTIQRLCDEIDARFPTEEDVTLLAEALAIAAFGEPQDPSEADIVECVTCQDRYSLGRTWQAPCGHAYCIECLENLHRTSMTDETLYPPRCCQRDMPWDRVRATIQAELAVEFEAKREELGTRDRVYCADAACAIFLGRAHIAGDVGTCPDCQKQTCVRCKSASHAGDCPADADLQMTLALAGDQGWKRCALCCSLVELNTGCNHIT